jgi:hypothetical protein
LLTPANRLEFDLAALQIAAGTCLTLPSPSSSSAWGIASFTAVA